MDKWVLFLGTYVEKFLHFLRQIVSTIILCQIFSKRWRNSNHILSLVLDRVWVPIPDPSLNKRLRIYALAKFKFKLPFPSTKKCVKLKTLELYMHKKTTTNMYYIVLHILWLSLKTILVLYSSMWLRDKISYRSLILQQNTSHLRFMKIHAWKWLIGLISALFFREKKRKK